MSLCVWVSGACLAACGDDDPGEETSVGETMGPGTTATGGDSTTTTASSSTTGETSTGTGTDEGSTTGQLPACVTEAKPHNLPLPSQVGRTAYTKALQEFVEKFEYRKLGWCEDKGLVRDTGPYIDGEGYKGTHPPVHMAYSPAAMRWLLEGRPEGGMPDGALIIKEQWYGVDVGGTYRSMMPAVAYDGMSRQELDDLFFTNPVQAGWTTMIKDSTGSHTGWFWAELYNGIDVDDPNSFEFSVANTGSPCERCHASAEVELTFIATENIAGFAGEPHTYNIESGWSMQTSTPAKSYTSTPEYGDYPEAFHPWLPGVSQPEQRAANEYWLRHFPEIHKVQTDEVAVFPPASFDHSAQLQPPMNQPFLTADQCIGCHGGFDGPGEPMYMSNPEPNGMGTDISPSGDWRFTPMGLAGRDPIFYAQLETEVAMVAADAKSEAETAAFTQKAVETCMGCHGGPGVRQAELDNVTFKPEFLYIDDPMDENFKYGALARDGINCTMCHHIEQHGSEAEFFEKYTTGRFEMSDKDIFGPYKDDTLHPKPMEHGVGFKPTYSPDIAESPDASRLCGHCHNIELPVIDNPKVPNTPPSEAFPIGFNDPDYGFPIHVEQATYTEWLNSQYQTIYSPTADQRSCQSCHMARDYQENPIQTIIASVQDSDYPEVPFVLPDLDLEPRTQYGRHQFVGLNIPLLQMFNQFYDVLGVNKSNYMSGLSTAINNTIAKMLAQAKHDTLDLDVTTSMEDEVIHVDVTLTNLTGHRFPSGVAFRRAYIETLVIERASGRTLWGSGRTNPVGVLIDGRGDTLDSENLDNNTWQNHYEIIDAEDEVQIYEEVPLNKHGQLTYSFLRRDTEIKDNRLLPKGWRKTGPEGNDLDPDIFEATHPKGEAADDPSYLDGSGSDKVRYRIANILGDYDPAQLDIRVAVYYQSTSPAFLQEKFKWSPNGPATRRLYYLMSNLDTKGTGMDDWRIELVSDQSPLQ